MSWSGLVGRKILGEMMDVEFWEISQIPPAQQFLGVLALTLQS